MWQLMQVISQLTEEEVTHSLMLLYPSDCRPIAKMLIDHGADLSATIHLGYTALRIATQDSNAVKYL